MTNEENIQELQKELYNSLIETPEWDALKQVGLDPNDITAKYINDAFRMHKRNAKQRQDFIISRFKNEIKIAAAVDNRGIVLGTVDEYTEDTTKRRPETFVVLTNDGSLKKGIAFKHDMITKPGIYTFDLNYDAERDSSIAKGVLDFKELNKDPLAFFGNESISITPSSSDWDDGTIVTSKYPPVLIRATVSSIRPIPKFAIDESGKSFIVGDCPIYMANGREPVPNMQPVIRLNLNPEKTTNYITVNFRQCMYSNPYFGISGINDAFAYAIEAEDEPERQIALIEHMFVGKEMVILGYVSKINQNVDKEGNESTQIAIRGIACLSTDPECTGFDEYVSAKKNVKKLVKQEMPTDEELEEVKPEPVAEKKAASLVNNPNAHAELDTTQKPESLVNNSINAPKEGVLSVDAVIIEDAPVELNSDSEDIAEDVDEDEDDEDASSNYPDYSVDPEGFVNQVVKDILIIIGMVHVDKSKVTVSYIKKTLQLENVTNVPNNIWKIIVNNVISSM